MSFIAKIEHHTTLLDPISSQTPMASTLDSQIQLLSSKRPEDDELKSYVFVGDLGKGSFATVYKGYT